MNISKSIVFLYTFNEQHENEIEETISCITSKRLKCLLNLAK